MNKAYKTETIELHGASYLVEWFYDEYAGAPWDNSDCHGPVTGWERRDKKPSEIILSSDRGLKRFYDFAEAMRMARRDGWSAPPYIFSSPGEQAHAAVMSDFEYLRRWCDGQWFYCGIVVTMLDEDGEKTQASDSICCVEDGGHDSAGYQAIIIQDLIGQCEYLNNRAAYPVNSAGV